MISLWNKNKYLHILLMTAKPVILLILLSGIIGLNRWRQDAFVVVPEVRLQKKSMYLQHKEKKSLAKAFPSFKPLMEVEMTSKQKNAQNRYHNL
jgi:hypothetical protein